MPITVTCQCGHQFRVRDEYAGKKAQCPHCGDPVVIPLADQPMPEPSAEFAPMQPAQTFPSASGRSSSGGGQWFGGLNSGLFGLGRLSGLACLLIGLTFVLLARGCDSLANRSAVSKMATYNLKRNEFNDEWDDKRAELTDEVERLREERDDAETPSEIDAIKEDLDKAQTDLAELDQDQARALRNKERGEWKTLKREARNAFDNNTAGQFWRELLFVAGTVILSIGLLTVGFTGEPHERRICLIMITIITFSIYVGGIAWIETLVARATSMAGALR